MTMREMLTKVKNNEITEEVIAKANEEIAKLDARNASRKEKPTKTQLENEPIIKAISELLTTEPMLATDIAGALQISVPKASALAKKVEGVQITEVKVPKKGKQNGYFLLAE